MPQEAINLLPPELQASLTSFINGLSERILSQQTKFRGEEVIRRVTPDQQKFYDKRFEEVLESQLFNPRVYPPVEIRQK